MLIEIHMLKSFPATCLNRGGDNSPKTEMFGGTLRSRISSQCLKNAWRTSDTFREEVGEENLGIRSRMIPEIICEELSKRNIEEDRLKAVSSILAKMAKKEKKEEDEDSEEKNKQTMFISPEDIRAFADAAEELIKGKSAEEIKKNVKPTDFQSIIKDAKSRAITVDIALWGRMVTSDIMRDIQASMQVLHAFSTHKVCRESDYFIAADDWARKLDDGCSTADKGAAMLGEVGFNASCYYIYAVIDTDALRKNLSYADDPDKLVKAAVSGVLHTMAYDNPKGKQNSFAGHALPSAVMIDCKEKKTPTSLANAFVKAISGENLVEDSIKQLAAEADYRVKDFGLPIKERLWFASSRYEARPETASRICKNYEEMVTSTIFLL